MLATASVDYAQTPARVDVPRDYNCAVEFIDRQLLIGNGDRWAVIDAGGRYSYAELAVRVNQAGNALRTLGIGSEMRVLLCLLDSIDFVALFWGAIKIGAVPVPVNTLLTSADYDYMLRDSRARLAAISQSLDVKFAPILKDQPALQHVLVAGGDSAVGEPLGPLLEAADKVLDVAPTTADDVAFWLYTSGSTGAPKGAMHLHRDLIHTAVNYGVGVLGMQSDDVVFSAAKLFFAYGLGNAMTFPFHVGACAVLLGERPTPAAVVGVLRDHGPTIFFGVPTLYAALLADSEHDVSAAGQSLRTCVSAGEPLPEETARRWQQRTGLEVLDGIGSTEMLHIYLSNRPDDVCHGTTGRPVPGYAVKVVTETGDEAAPGEIGELLVRGPSAAIAYWNQRDKSLDTFQGPWVRTGDKYAVDEAGYYRFSGRADDMLKVSGQWVSPFDVEFALIGHDAVLEAAVVGQPDDNDLVKPKAYVVLKDGVDSSPPLEQELKDHVKTSLAPFKYPRWIEFVDQLPKTATGKIQRFKLR